MCAQAPSALTALTALTAPTALSRCHCPHLVAVGSGFRVFKTHLEASICAQPLQESQLSLPHLLFQV